MLRLDIDRTLAHKQKTHMAKTKGRKPNIITPRGLRGMKTDSGRIKNYSNECVDGKRTKKDWG